MLYINIVYSTHQVISSHSLAWAQDVVLLSSFLRHSVCYYAKLYCQLGAQEDVRGIGAEVFPARPTCCHLVRPLCDGFYLLLRGHLGRGGGGVYGLRGNGRLGSFCGGEGGGGCELGVMAPSLAFADSRRRVFILRGSVVMLVARVRVKSFQATA